MADLTQAKEAIRLYSIWQQINSRCNNLTDKAYHRYGGRGIKVEWQDFDQFYLDMVETHQFHLTLDRVDNDGNYSRENCKWATRMEQANNRSTNTVLELDGVKHTIQEWSRKLGMKKSVISMRLNKYGWSVEKALTTPVRKWGN